MRKIRVEKVGRAECVRFVLADQRGCYWSGSRWCQSLRKALLFCEYQDAALAYKALEEKRWEGQPVRRFVAPVNVVVRGNPDFDLGRLQDYLCAVVAVCLDHNLHGPAPSQNSVAVVEINWSDLQEVPQGDGGER